MIIPREYQAAAVNSIFKYFNKKSGNPIVALPTGTGKSVIIADFIQKVMKQWPGQRFLMLTHVKELIEQNAHKLEELWPSAPYGIYSAGLKSRDTGLPIIFGGIQSAIKNIKDFGHRDLMLVDEAHLISPKANTMYQKAIAELKEINPYLKVIGLSATPFRLGLGYITDGGIFTDVCFDMCDIKGFKYFLDNNYMSMLIPKQTNIELQTEEVKKTGGEYIQKHLQSAVDKSDINIKVCKEIIEQGYDRKSWLIFTSGINHAEHISEILTAYGIDAVSIHSKIKAKERNQRLEAFKKGEIRAVVNNNVLTTGFDHPEIDLIGMLRPTCSASLWVQMLGRGTRPAEGKENCLVLDFAGNSKRLGPINDPLIPKKKGSKGDGVAPIKICENCGCYAHASVRECVVCGHKFPIHEKLTKYASNAPLIKQIEPPKYEWFEVNRVFSMLHKKKDKIDSVKITYINGVKSFNEWIFPEHEPSNFAHRKSKLWWSKRTIKPLPNTCNETLQVLKQINQPKKIKVLVNKKYPEIVDYLF